MLKTHKGEKILEHSQYPIGQKWMFGNILREKNLELPAIYFAHKREIVRRSNSIVPVTESNPS